MRRIPTESEAQARRLPILSHPRSHVRPGLPSEPLSRTVESQYASSAALSGAYTAAGGAAPSFLRLKVRRFWQAPNPRASRRDFGRPPPARQPQTAGPPPPPPLLSPCSALLRRLPDGRLPLVPTAGRPATAPPRLEASSLSARRASPLCWRRPRARRTCCGHASRARRRSRSSTRTIARWTTTTTCWSRPAPSYMSAAAAAVRRRRVVPRALAARRRAPIRSTEGSGKRAPFVHPS
eukprot:5370441-Prymnesium_polylepis.1